MNNIPLDVPKYALLKVRIVTTHLLYFKFLNLLFKRQFYKNL